MEAAGAVLHHLLGVGPHLLWVALELGLVVPPWQAWFAAAADDLLTHHQAEPDLAVAAVLDASLPGGVWLALHASAVASVVHASVEAPVVDDPHLTEDRYQQAERRGLHQEEKMAVGMSVLRRPVGATDLKQGYQVHLWEGILEAVFAALVVEVYQRAPPSLVVSWAGVQVDSGPGRLEEEVVEGSRFAFGGSKVKVLITCSNLWTNKMVVGSL